MKLKLFFAMFLLSTVIGLGQNTTIECKLNELIDKRINCANCGGEDELFSGLLITQNGRITKIYAPYKVKFKSSIRATILDTYGNTYNINVRAVRDHDTKEKLITFLQSCYPGAGEGNTISEVLTTGNDAVGLDIDNVGDIRADSLFGDGSNLTGIVKSYHGTYLSVEDATGTGEIKGDYIIVSDPATLPAFTFTPGTHTIYENPSTQDTNKASENPIEVYNNTGDGMTGTTNLDYFGVWNDPNIDVYLEQNGSAILQYSGIAKSGYDETVNGYLVVPETESDRLEYVSYFNGNSWKKWVDGSLLMMVNDYTELRSISIKDSMCFVKDFTYDFNTISYTTKGGMFYYNGCTENGGTCVGGWKRNINTAAYQPEWWEVGGYDQNGDTISNILINQEGIYNDRDRIQAAINVQGESAIVELTPGYIYLIDIPLRYPKYFILDGNKGQLKRVDAINTTLSSNYIANNTTIDVVSTNGMRSGMPYIFGDSTSTLNSNGVILSISGNTITNTGGVPTAYSSGQLFSTASTTIAPSSTYTEHDLTIRGVIFDGNNSNNDQLLSWDQNGTINYQNAKILRIYDCEVYDTPSGVINGGPACIVDKIVGKNIWGGFHHNSNSGSVNEYHGIYNRKQFSNIQLDSVGEKFIELSHEEAVFVASNNTYGYEINNVNVTNLFSSPMMLGTGQQNHSRMNNCLFRAADGVANNNGIFNRSQVNGQGKIFDFQINDCTFENFGQLYWAGSDMDSSYTDSGIKFINNTFVNCHFEFQKVHQVSFVDNEFYFDETHPSYSILFGSLPNSENAWFSVKDVSDFRFEGNKVYGPTVYNSFFQNGISFRTLGVDAVDGDFWAMQNISVKNNIIWGFRVGIHTGAGGYNSFPNGERGVRNFIFNNNTIVTEKNAIAGTNGIRVHTGAQADYNTIFCRSNSAGSSGIMVYGVEDNTLGNINKLHGGTANYNTIYSENDGRPMFIGGNLTNTLYNIRTTNNVFYGGRTTEGVVALGTVVNELNPTGFAIPHGNYRVDIEMGIDATWIIPPYERYSRNVGIID